MENRGILPLWGGRFIMLLYHFHGASSTFCCRNAQCSTTGEKPKVVDCGKPGCFPHFPQGFQHFQREKPIYAVGKFTQISSFRNIRSKKGQVFHRINRVFHKRALSFHKGGFVFHQLRKRWCKTRKLSERGMELCGYS